MKTIAKTSQGTATVRDSAVRIVQLDRLMYSVPAAARLMGISSSKLWALCMAGAIGSCKIGAARRVPATAIAQFIEEHSMGGNQDAA